MLTDQRYYSALDNPSLESLTQLINELANIEIKYLKSQTDTLLKQIEIEKREMETKIFGLKEEITKLGKKNKDLSNDLNSLKFENQNSNATIVKMKSQNDTLEQKLFDHFDVKSIDAVLHKADQLLQIKEELVTTKHTQRELEVQLLLEKKIQLLKRFNYIESGLKLKSFNINCKCSVVK